MRKSRSRFALLPQHLRDQLNRKLADGWQYEQIRHWLFAEKADRDIPALDLRTGDSYALAWTRTIPDEKRLIRNFGIALSGWYHTHFQQWREEQADHDDPLRLLQNVDQLATAATASDRADARHGGNLILRSLILDATRHARKGDNSVTELVRLANTWIRLSQSDERPAKRTIRIFPEDVNAASTSLPTN